ncbi:ABC-F family ATP-binding cassette domain-containing protein [Nakamurella aerolata]|uniref:ABC-F family ATP-binding cassette domain-containing protein n=1 Tax=Nakamurella aerolata TaxID=1656892 RepID=A0A849AG45_9ACTN|nr:ABC-F family ATP-binding cassette domain-containing protein [Nakamurella aerolata]NNG35802.1 ABC-F family ATP-binding cassette domain-containing protein [Nakamurella aerolata]
MAGRNLVNLEIASITLGITQVLSGVSLGVQAGDRIGVLGLNGAGKSTLLALLAGQLTPDSGRVSVAGGVSIAAVTQQTQLSPDATVRDVALQAFADQAEHAWAGDSAVREVLAGLGLRGIGLDTPLASLSGGEQRRVALAAALVTDADLLILDEPTNHIDVEGVSWLAAYLLRRQASGRGALVMVTHDRWFLDAVAGTTWEVVDGRVEIRDGGYSDWVFARAERLRLDRAAQERQRNLARKELAWLRRGAPARTSKPRYRVEAAEALISDVPAPRDTVALHSFAGRRLGKDVLDLEDVSVRLPAPAGGGNGAGRQLLSDVTWRVGPGDRIGIVGVNGSGKSTLLRLLADDPRGTSLLTGGRIRRGATVELGYLSQDAAELNPELRVLEAVTEVGGRLTLAGRELSAGQLAEEFGFPANRQWMPVADLSGGQRRRLQLMRVLMASPNVLLLDEPTNDLDTDTLTALEDLLDSWPGTLIVVSHDRYLIERVTDDVYALLGDGRITHLPGGIDEYLRRRERADQSGDAGRGKPAAAQQPATTVTGPEAGQPGIDQGTARDLRKQLQRLDKQLESLRRKQSNLTGELADVGDDYVRAAELDAALTALTADLDAAETEWLEVAERLEG